MPNIRSAKKRVKVSATKTAANKARKSNLKTMIKKADAACATNAADKETAVRVAIKRVDQACAKGLMHKNAAARKKSQLAKKLQSKRKRISFCKEKERMPDVGVRSFCTFKLYFKAAVRN